MHLVQWSWQLDLGTSSLRMTTMECWTLVCLPLIATLLSSKLAVMKLLLWEVGTQSKTPCFLRWKYPWGEYHAADFSPKIQNPQQEIVESTNRSPCYGPVPLSHWSVCRPSVLVWIRLAPVGSYVWLFGSQLVKTFAKIWAVLSGWRCIIWERLWGFKRPLPVLLCILPLCVGFRSFSCSCQHALVLPSWTPTLRNCKLH